MNRLKNKIDKEVLVKAIVSGMTYNEAGKLAGSTAKNPKHSVKDIVQIPTVKRDIITQLEEKRQWILNSIKEEDIKKAPIQVKSVMLGVITDKIQLLKGDPTQNIGIIPRLVEQGNVISFKAQNPLLPCGKPVDNSKK